MTQERVALLEMITSYRVTQALYVTAKLGVADLLVDGPRHCDDLARAVDADPDSLYRVMRALAGKGVFADDGTRTFELTRLGRGLCSDSHGSMRAWAIMVGGEHHWQPMGGLLDSVRTGRPVFEEILGQLPFTYYEQNPEELNTFHSALGGLSEIVNAALLDVYDFAPFHSVMDVGGGNGSLLFGILRGHPAMRGIIFDREETLARAEPLLRREPELRRRCDLVVGDFFETVAPGADLYILKHILHDWNDKESVQILKQVHAAMPPEARLLIIEMVIEPNGSSAYPKFLDLEMLVSYTGRERTVDEYANLLAQSGLELHSITPTDALVSIIEAVPSR